MHGPGRGGVHRASPSTARTSKDVGNRACFAPVGIGGGLDGSGYPVHTPPCFRLKSSSLPGWPGPAENWNRQWTGGVLSDDALIFLRHSIKTVWTLEILLILRRDPDRAWNSEDLIRESRSSTLILQEVFENLEKAGMIVMEGNGRFRYRRTSPLPERLVEEITSVQARRPAAITKALLSVSSGKVRTFADGFHGGKSL